jgi:hypothetical protein
MSTHEFVQPLPGDMVYAVHRMRAWESDHERGADGIWVEPGQYALILQLWKVGRGRSRMRVLTGDRIVVFSCYTQDLPRNWRVVNRQATVSGSR